MHVATPAAGELGLVAQALSLFRDQPLGIRLFVRARSLLAPLERIAAEAPPNGHILDLGCGHGLFSAMLALQSPGSQVLGLDPSPAKIEVARSSAASLPNLSFRVGTVDDLLEERFSAITIVDVLYLLPYPDKLDLLKTARAVLEPGGQLVLKTNDTHPAWRYGVAYAQERIMTGMGLTLGQGLFFLSCLANEALLRRAGFESRMLHLAHWSPYPHTLLVATPSVEG